MRLKTLSFRCSTTCSKASTPGPRSHVNIGLFPVEAQTSSYGKRLHDKKQRLHHLISRKSWMLITKPRKTALHQPAFRTQKPPATPISPPKISPQPRFYDHTTTPKVNSPIRSWLRLAQTRRVLLHRAPAPHPGILRALRGTCPLAPARNMRQLWLHTTKHFALGNRLMSLLRRHCLAISLINRDPLTSFLVRDYFDLARSTSLYAALKDASLGQADLVLCLLRLRDAQPMPDRKRLLSFYIARLVGRPIAIGMPCLLHYRVNGHAPVIAAPPTPAERRVAWVTPANPRQPGTVAHQRWVEFKVGRTVAQLRVRGITRRDLRKAERRGWLRYEEVAA